MFTSPIGTSAPPSDQVLPVAQLRHLYKPEISSATQDQAPVSRTTFEHESGRFRAFHGAFKEVPADIVQLIIEETVRLAPGKMPEQLAALRGVNRLFQFLADRTELQAKDIAYASTARKTVNILIKGKPPHLRKPTMEALYGIWPHIAVPLCRIDGAANRKILLETLASKSGKASLSLQLHDITPGEFNHIRAIMSNNPQAPIKLQLLGSTLALADLKLLLQMFAEDQPLVELVFGERSLSDEDCRELAPVIAGFSKLQTLEIINALETPLAMQSMVPALRSLESLVRLKLAFGMFEPRSVELLASALVEFKSLAELELRGLSLQWPEMNELTEIAAKLPPIKDLCLAQNWFGTDGMDRLCPVLQALRHSLESLDLEYTGIGPDAAQMLAAVLPELDCLKRLSLDLNPISEGGVQALFPVLGEHRTIHELSIVDCAITYANVTTLVDALAEKNHSLRHLEIDWYPMRESEVTILLLKLKQIESLRTVILHDHNQGIKRIELQNA